MSVTPQRPYGIWITIALAIVGGIVVAAIWFTSGRASDVDLTTANFVPAEAGVYVALNTDLKSPQWISAFDLVERLGEEDPQGQLEQSAEDDGYDWEEEVVPFLGGNAAFFVTSVDAGLFDVSGGVVVQAKDLEAAMDVIEGDEAFDWQSDTYLDVPFLYDPDAGSWVAAIDGHIVGTMDEASLLDVIDIARGNRPSLADREEFSNLRNELSKNFLGFVYVDAQQMIGDALGGPELDEIFAAAGADFAIQPMAGVIGAESDAFTFQAASRAEDDAGNPMLAPRESRFAGRVPGNTAVFITTAGLSSAVDQAIEAAGETLDGSFWENTPYRDLDDALDAIGQEAGIGSIRDIVDLFHGETAVALWFPTGDSNEPEGLVLTEVRDAAQARKTIDALLAELPGVGYTTVNGVEMAHDGEGFALALDEGDFLAGSRAAVESVLQGPASPLAGSSTYTETLGTLPTATGTFAFFDMASILRLASGGIPAELDRAEEALDGLIINMVDERGVTRISGTLTVE